MKSINIYILSCLLIGCAGQNDPPTFQESETPSFEIMEPIRIQKTKTSLGMVDMKFNNDSEKTFCVFPNTISGDRSRRLIAVVMTSDGRRIKQSQDKGISLGETANTIAVKPREFGQWQINLWGQYSEVPIFEKGNWIRVEVLAFDCTSGIENSSFVMLTSKPVKILDYMQETVR